MASAAGYGGGRMKYFSEADIKSYLLARGFAEFRADEVVGEITSTADVRENVHGEWEDNYPILCEFQSLRCNQCHCLVPKKNFCCNCGAIMREVTK